MHLDAGFHGGGGVPRLRTRVPVRTFVVENPMPASKADIEELRGIVKWLKTGGGDEASRGKVTIEALERALEYLSEPDERYNIVRFVLAALVQSMPKRNDMYVCVDRALQSWAMDQANEILANS